MDDTIEMNYDHEVISVFGYIWGCTTANFQASELCERQKHIEMHRWIACWFVIYKYFIKLKRAILLSAIHTAQHTTIYIPSTHKHTNIYVWRRFARAHWIMTPKFEWSLYQLWFLLLFLFLFGVWIGFLFLSSLSLYIIPFPSACLPLPRSSISSFSFIPVTFANGLFIWNRTEMEYIKIFIYLLSFGCCYWALLML